ncbi:MAG TPA: FAD-dependent oxidoreductase, partial [Ktedonobacterales bacterium]
MTGPTGRKPVEAQSFDLIIIGGGVAGLSILLTLPTSLRVALLTKAALGESNTRYAQGGLAAPVGPDDDPELQLRDTLTAGAGLVDEGAARAMLAEAREAVAWLIAQGTRFDERGHA